MNTTWCTIYYTGWWFQIFFIFPRKLGKIPILTSIFFQRVETTNKFYFLGWFWGVVQCNENPGKLTAGFTQKWRWLEDDFPELQLGELLFLEFSVINTPEI